MYDRTKSASSTKQYNSMLTCWSYGELVSPNAACSNRLRPLSSGTLKLVGLGEIEPLLMSVRVLFTTATMSD